jgi:hypothetical protein
VQFLPVPLFALTLAVLALPTPAQRGRGRSEAIVQRVGCFFVDGKLEAAQGDASDPFQGIAALREAATAHYPAVLYLFDPKADTRKHEQYEVTTFGNDELGVALRCFRCVRLDVTSEPSLSKLVARAPLFVAFDPTGKQAGELSQAGYKNGVPAVVKLLEKAAAGHVKPSLAQFVTGYRDLVRELEVAEGRKKTLDDRQSRLEEKDTAKRAEMEKERKQLEADVKALDTKETEMLRLAKVPPRVTTAIRLGERKGGR